VRFSFDPRTAVLMAAAGIIVFTVRRFERFIRRWLSYLLDALFWRASRHLQRSLSSRLTLKRYCHLELNATASKYLQVPGPSTIQLKTDESFVPLLLDEGHGGDLSFSHSTLLEAGNRIRIIGDPGSGKSSLVKRLYRDACREGLERAKQARFPIRIELKEFVPPDREDDDDQLLAWGLEWIRSHTTVTDAYDIEECYDSYLRDGGLLLLLDGLDEVPASAYGRVATLIRLLSNRLERLSDRSVIVLTMRVQFHRQVGNDFDTSFPRTLHIRPFSPNDIFRFLAQWPFTADVSGQVNRIYGDLTDRPTLREMCTNPLVLAMYVASDQLSADSTDVPETRTWFYSQVVTELLIARRWRQVGPPSARTALVRQREAILGQIALEHLLDPNQPTNALSWAAAVDAAVKVLNYQADQAEAYLRDLSKETGLFTEEREGESLRFIHLTFCEFFAAQEAAEGRSSGWDDLIRAHQDFRADDRRQVRARLAEVIPFAVGLLPRSRIERGLDDALRLEDSQILARCFLETQYYAHPAWEGFARREIDALASESPEDWNQDWLRRLHLLSTVLRESERWAASTGGRPPAVTSGELFQRLVGADEERLVRVFSSYSMQDAAASFRLAEVCGVDLVAARPDLVVESCASPPFLALAVDRTNAGEGVATNWPKVLAEAGLRFQVVAVRLGQARPIASWSHALARLPSRDNWSRPIGGARSLYGDCLALGCNGERGSTTPTVFPLLRVVTEVRAPGTLVRDRILLMLSAMAMVCTFTGFVFVAFATSYRGSLPLILRILPVLGFYLLAIELMGYAARRRAVYRRVLNLAPTSRVDDLPAPKGVEAGPTLVASRAPVRTGSMWWRALPTGWFARAALHRQERVALLLERLRGLVGGAGSDPMVYQVLRDGGGDVVVERLDGKIAARLPARRGEVVVEAQVTHGD
jgi:hypothetical protein